MDIDFTLGLIHAFNIGDVLNDLASQLRPYEAKKGSTEIALHSSVEHMATVLERSYRSYRSIRVFRTIRRFLGHVFNNSIPRELGRCREYFGQVCLDPSLVKPVVKITGEFWAQTTEGAGNFRMFEFLEEEGAQVVLEPIATWLLYMLHQAKQETRDRVFIKTGAKRSISSRAGTAVAEGIEYLFTMLKLTLAELLYTRDYNRLRKMLDCIPWPLPSQRLFKKLAEPFFNTRIEGGEGHLEIAKTLYYTQNRLCHMMLSLKPFGCLPSTQSDGVMSTVTAHHPGILFLPIETAGDGGIHAYSRVQMTLAEAKKRARMEYEQALSESLLSTEAMHEFLARHPEVRNPFHRFWKDGPAVPKAACLARCIARSGKGSRNRI
jgi:predicted nucleotide-binding protein (sugar kinase/HSP70/actin superfamily)